MSQGLEKVLKGEVTSNEKELEKYSEDASIFHVTPSCVVRPKDAQDLRSLILFVKEQNSGMSLTARSAGTDMTGGPLSDSIIVDFLPYFNNVIEVADGWAKTQPGVFYRDFEKQTLEKGWLLPCYTASRELNTVGGMVANNSGGEKSLVYGKTERYVRALKMVLEDGNEYTFKKLSHDELEDAKRSDSYLSEIYRRMDTLLEENNEIIQNARPNVSKNSAGYALWDIWNKKDDTFDLTKLFVGSQGTLGLITEIDFSLVRPKKHSQMLVVFLKKKHMNGVGALVHSVLKHGPESFESYDDHTFKILLKVLPSMMGRLGANIFSLAWKFLPEMRAILTGGIPKLVLLAEFTGDDPGEVAKRVYEAQVALKEFSVVTHITKDENESEKYWVIRRESFNLLRKHVHGKKTAPFIDDVVVLPEKLPEFLPKLYALLDEYKITYTVAGHIGDGNLHIIPLMDFERPDFRELIKELSLKVYDLVFSFDGSMTGEHNDGLIRTPYLTQMYGTEMVKLFAEVKNIFDPQGVFNPHKKVDSIEELDLSLIKK